MEKNKKGNIMEKSILDLWSFWENFGWIKDESIKNKSDYLKRVKKMGKITMRKYVKAKILEPTKRLGRRIKYTYNGKSKTVPYNDALFFRQQCIVDIPELFDVELSGEFIYLDEQTDLVLLKEEQ
jgi:hypothetical protein